MILVVIFLAFTISLQCDATANFLCYTYDESSKSLELYCDQQQTPVSCIHQEPTLGTLQVVHLKIEGCDQSRIGDASEKYPDIQSLDVSYSGDRSLNWTGKNFQNVINFKASSINLRTIITPIFDRFPNLETIDLSNNYIEKIYSGSFKNCEKLKQIILSHNRLDSIAPDAFNNLKELSEIYLADNRFSTFPAAIFTKSIKEIDISENYELSTINCTLISAMDDKVVNFTWKYIKRIEFDQNCGNWKLIVENNSNENEGIHAGFDNQHTKLRCKSPCFGHLESFIAGPKVFENVSDVLNHLKGSVREIDLSGNNVDNLNINTFLPFEGLNKLSLSNTGLKKFAFNWMSKHQENFLNHLDISNNDLKVVQNASLLQNFENLKYFNGEGNQIHNANEIAQYIKPTIKQLNLAGSNVSNIDNFGRFIALKRLNLSDTSISDVSVDPFKTLLHLTSLDVSHNNLSNIDFANFFYVADQLQEFRAADSQLKNVSDVFQYIKPSVRILDLSGSYVGPIANSSLFQKLVKLTYLNLSGTNLQKFDFEVIKPLQSLQSLDISHNNLRSIDLSALSHFTRLERLYLNDNDLTKLDHYNWTASPNVALDISKNHFSCMDLKDLKHEIPNLKYIGNQLDQKHGEDCLSSTQAIGDFLGSVYDKVKFW